MAWLDIQWGGPGAGFPRPELAPGVLPEEERQRIIAIVEDIKKQEAEILAGFGRVSIADIFILIGFGLMFGDTIVKGLTAVINALLPRLLAIAG